MTGRRLPFRGSRFGAILLVASLLVALPSPASAFTEYTGVDIELPRGVAISGTISGGTVVGSTVSACANDICDHGATVAADGTYRIPGLVADTYLVRVDPPEPASDLLDGWYTASGPVVEQVDAEPIDATGGDVSGIDLTLETGHRISGTVTVTGVGTPAGIEVRANGPSSEAATTASNGTFQIRGLRDGSYTLSVSVPDTLDGLSGPVVGGAVGDPEDDGTEILVAGADVTGQAITTPRGRRMSGRLTGTGVAGGRVYGLTEAMERSAVMDAEGDWVLRGLRPGAYQLLFDRPQSDEFFQSLFPFGWWDAAGALALSDAAATSITVGGVDVTGRNASVPAAAVLSGTVAAIDGSSLGDAYVYACSDDVGCVSTLTDESGAWSFAGMRAGSYVIQAWHAHHPGGWYGVGGFADDEAHARNVAVGATNVGPIRIILPDGGAIEGRVTDPDSDPVADVFVTGSDGGGLPPVPPGTDQTASDGTYRIDGLRPGWWSIFFHPSDGAEVLPGYSDVEAADGYAADIEDSTELLIEGPEGLSYRPITPLRVVDSRTPLGVAGAFLNGVPRSFVVAGVGSIPDDAWAVTGNVTIVGQTSSGYLSVGPTMSATPTSSTLNAPKGDVRANNITLPLNETGGLAAVFKGAAGSTTHVIVDITGYFVPGDQEATYDTISPTRMLDTRPGSPLRTGTPRTLVVAGKSGIPSGAVAITANLTVVGQSSSGYLSVTPTAQTNPTTSTLNAPKGDTRANGLTARLSGSGALAIVWKGASGGTADVILDVTGYYLDAPGGMRFYPVSPGRVLDTRSAAYATMLTGTFQSGTPRSLQVGGHAFLPATIGAVTGNLTVVGQSAGGYVSMTPTPTATPSTSTLNMPAGDTRANGVTVPVSGGDDVAFVYKSSSGARTNLILDVTGYFAAP